SDVIATGTVDGVRWHVTITDPAKDGSVTTTFCSAPNRVDTCVPFLNVLGSGEPDGDPASFVTLGADRIDPGTGKVIGADEAHIGVVAANVTYFTVAFA